MNFRPCAAHASPVVPPPMNGSHTVSPGSVNRHTQSLTSGSGLLVGWPRKADDQKLVRLVLFVPQATAQKVEQHGQEWSFQNQTRQPGQHTRLGECLERHPLAP